MVRFSFLFIGLLISSFSSAAGFTPWQHFEIEGGHIKIPISLAGVETTAIIDSGAQLHGINNAFIGKNQPDLVRTGKVNIRGAFGTEKRDRFSRVPVTVFDTDFKLDSVVELSLGHHSNGLLLGAPLFTGSVVQIDYPQKRMRLLTRDVVNLAEVENTGMVQQDGTGQPLVKVTINDRELWFLLDTGSTGGLMMERKDARRLGLLETVTHSGTSQGANTTRATESTRVDTVTLGPYTLDNVLVSFMADGQTSNLSSQSESLGSHIKGKRVAGLLGYDLLKHFILTLDYERDQLHIGLPAD